MTSASSAAQQPLLAIDMMGADAGVGTVAQGLALAMRRGLVLPVELHGRTDEIEAALTDHGVARDPITICHADDVISMTDKPSSALRRGKGSSMWSAIAAVKDGRALAAVSSGNTGALMAMSVFQLRMIKGIDRPAISALWPSAKGQSVVLDVGANVECSAAQLVQFAIMGESYFRALTGKSNPSVGLLNVGSEDLKGHETIRSAAEALRAHGSQLDFRGFIEGNDISAGEVDVVVTDGFTGNIALKTAEGTAHLVGGWIKRTLTSSWRAKLASLLMMPGLKALKGDMDPSRVNGAPLLGLNGLVLKSHGGADANGICAAILRAERLATHPFQDEIERTASLFAAAGEGRDMNSSTEEHAPAAQ